MKGIVCIALLVLQTLAGHALPVEEGVESASGGAEEVKAALNVYLGFTMNLRSTTRIDWVRNKLMNLTLFA